MTTKDCCPSPKRHHRCNNLSSSSDSNFTNVNLNSNVSHKCLEVLSVESNSISNKKNKFNALATISDYTVSNRSEKSAISKTKDKRDKISLISEYSNRRNSKKDKKDKKNKNNAINSSTLSLHIAAYENYIEAEILKTNSDTSSTKLENKNDLACKWKNIKQKVLDQSKSFFEIPRQGKDSEASKPEIMQFKASQKLLNPNKPQLKTNKKESENVNEKDYQRKQSVTDINGTSQMESDNQILNHCRILQLLSKSCDHFQRIFKQRWGDYQKLNNALKEWEDSEEDRSKLIELCPDASVQMKESMKNDSLELWDITLFNNGIYALSKEIKRLNGKTDKQENVVIGCIREIRNKIHHAKKPMLSDEEFSQYFTQLSSLMIKLGETQSTMDEIKINLMKIGGLKIEPQVESIRKEFKKLKEEANKLFQAKKYNEALDAYDEILKLSGLSREDQALIYSNISAAHLSLKTENSNLKAKRSADFTIHLWPCWFRGYFRLGKAEDKLGNLVEAAKALQFASALNSGSKEIRDELSSVLDKLGKYNREDHLNTYLVQDDYPTELEENLKILKLNESEFLKVADPDALNGEKWRLGFNGKQDYEKALSCHAKSANKGNTFSMFLLGKMYREGLGCPKNYDYAITWLKRAAESKKSEKNGGGIAEAQHYLGYMYFKGEGVKKDYCEAYKWYLKALDNGNYSSANNLGAIYMHGYGVERSPEKAFEYLKFSAESGEPTGMENLAKLLLMGYGSPTGSCTEQNKIEAIKWLKFAAEKGNLRAERTYNEVKNMSIDEIMEKAVEKLPSIIRENNPLDKELYGKSVLEAAKKGSITAKEQLEIWKQLNIATSAFKSRNSEEMVLALSKAIRTSHIIIFPVPEYFKSTLQERFKSHPNDINAFTSYITSFMPDNFQLSLKSIEEKLKAYPEDEYLHDLRVAAYWLTNNLKGALKASQSAIQLLPNSLRLLDGYATVLYGQQPPAKECITTLDKFISVAPVDHPRIPACHYLKARYYYSVTNEVSKFKASYEAGIAAEKKQLACYLPYYFPDKEYLGKLYAKQVYLSNTSKVESVVGQDGISSPCRSLDKIKMNMKRKHFIRESRKNFVELHEECSSGTPFLELIRHPSSVAAESPNVTSLKNIFLKDMNHVDEKFYDGYVLKGRIIDWSLPLLSLVALFEDDNGDVQKLIACVESKEILTIRDIQNIINRFRPNVKISIINPYKKIGKSGVYIIRVENPACLITDDTDADEKCSCCGKKTEVYLCSGCKMSRYCSKECQKYDWSELDHKIVCKHLGKYGIGKR